MLAYVADNEIKNYLGKLWVQIWFRTSCDIEECVTLGCNLVNRVVNQISPSEN